VLLGDVLIPGENPATKQLIQVYEATGVGRDCGEEVAEGKNKFVRHRGWPGAPQPPLAKGCCVYGTWVEEAETGECAFESGDYRDGLRSATRFRLPGAHEAGRRK